nr:MAG TPA: hypothetical protein [Caudoviricetes sp.]
METGLQLVRWICVGAGGGSGRAGHSEKSTALGSGA